MSKNASVKSNTTKRIYNPVTSSYYAIRARSTVAGNKGTIIGKWSSKPKTASIKKK
jgi:hypothetical protein